VVDVYLKKYEEIRNKAVPHCQQTPIVLNSSIQKYRDRQPSTVTNGEATSRPGNKMNTNSTKKCAEGTWGRRPGNKRER